MHYTDSVIERIAVFLTDFKLNWLSEADYVECSSRIYASQYFLSVSRGGFVLSYDELEIETLHEHHIEITDW